MNGTMSIVWLVLMIVLAITEAGTLGLTAIWFAFGSLVAMIAAILGANIWVQLILFLVASAVLLYFTRPLARKYFNNKARVKTNADRVVGMHGVVTERIDNEAAAGQVRVAGQVWTARSIDGTVIEAGEGVVVRSIAGVKVMVEKQAAPAAGI